MKLFRGETCNDSVDKDVKESTHEEQVEVKIVNNNKSEEGSNETSNVASVVESAIRAAGGRKCRLTITIDLL